MRSILLVCCILTGCLGKPVPPRLAIDAKESSLPVVHIVKHSNETMAEISRWYTGDATNAVAIARYNGKNHVTKLSVGESILVPEFLVKTRKPLVSKDTTAKKNQATVVKEKNSDKKTQGAGEKDPKDMVKVKGDTQKIIKETQIKPTQDNISSKAKPKTTSQVKGEQEDRKLDELRYQYLKELNEM